ncbi:MAG: 5'/3'-nucleotidase SurE [Leptolyngbyaceae cyanobacterium bins.59]|nr:5'/3'-nucleotidase SurE [Leptolyngbyaceae cyanobacterium bins.59]
MIVLTNDDGIDAPGLQALRKAVDDRCIVIAPQEHLSGCGHQVTTTRPIAVERRSDRAFAVAGTPADCVRLAVSHLCPEVKWVLSGINAGGNLGADTYISGTVAAVREAALHGVPAIAISHYRKGNRSYHWEMAAQWTAKVVESLMQQPPEPGSFWNVNLPHLEPGEPEPEQVFCPLSTRPLPIHYKLDGDCFVYAGDYSLREREPDSDIDICFSGRIAMTQVWL